MRKNKIKEYGRICGRCGEYHITKRDNGIRPYHGAICGECKIKSSAKKYDTYKFMITNKWRNRILAILKIKNKITIPQLARELECSIYTVRRILKLLQWDPLIKVSKLRPAVVWI